MKISNPNLNRLTHFEFFTFLKNVIDNTDPLLEEMPVLFTNKFAELEDAFETFDDVLAQERRMAPGGLIEAEEKRDHAIRKLYSLVREYSDFPYVNSMEVAANELLKLFKVYGKGTDIARMTQDIETGVIFNIIGDIRTSLPKQEALTTLNLMHVYDSLITHNDVFDQTQLTRRQEDAKFIAGIVKQARIEAQNVFMAFVDVVFAHTIMESDEKYTNLMEFMSNLFNDFVVESKRRGKKKEKDMPDEEVPEEETTEQ